MRRRGVCARGGTTGVIRNAELGRGDARVSGVEVLLMRFALGSRLLLRFCRGALPSVCARPCDSVGAFCLGLRAALRLCRGVLPRFARGLAALSGRFVLGLRAALRLCRGVLPRFARGLAALSGRFATVCARPCGSVAAFSLGSRLLFAALRQTGRLAISCVSIPPGRDRHLCVLAASVRLSALVGSLRV